MLSFLLAPATSEGRGLEGTWLVEKGEAKVEIESCGSFQCGRIAWIRDSLDASGHERRDIKNPDPALRHRLVNGLVILTGVQAVPSEKGNRWKGRIYDPRSGHTYRCKLELLSPGVLKIRGYLGLSLLGRTTRWTRAGP